MSNTNNSILLGIDLGTLNTRASVVTKNFAIERLNFKNVKNKIPSYVSFANEERFVGSLAKKRLQQHLENTIYGHVQILGLRFDNKIVQEHAKESNVKIIDDNGITKYKFVYKGEEKLVRPEEITAIILEEVKRTAEKLYKTKIAGAVITVPQHFNSSQRQAVADAAKIAGLQVLRIINKTTAVALSYCNDKLDDKSSKKSILIYHLGAATFDLSIVEINGTNLLVKYTDGGYKLGGLFINNIILKWVLKQLNKTEIDPKTLSYIKKDIEKAKKQLSSSNDAYFNVPKYNFETVLTKLEFNKLIASDIIEKTQEIIVESLKTCNMLAEDIDQVVLVGGCSKTEAIHEMLSQQFKKIYYSSYTEYMPTYGASILARQLIQSTSINYTISDIHRSKISWKYSNAKYDLLFKECTKLPAYTSRNFGEKSFNIYDNINNKIDTYSATTLPINPSIYLNFCLDVNGLLKIHAMEENGGQNLSFVSEYKLSDDSINTLTQHKNFIQRQHSKVQIHKEAVNKLEETINELRPVVHGLKIETKFKEIFENICQDAKDWQERENTRGNVHRKILEQKEAIEIYVTYVKNLEKNK